MIQNNSTKANGKLTPRNIFLSALYVAACLFIPVIFYIDMENWLANAISLALAAASLVAFSKAANGFKHVFVYAVMLFGTFLLGAGSFLLTGALASLACLISLFSYLCFNSSVYLTVALPAIAYIPALAITRDPVAATLVFFSLPAAMLTVYAIKKEKTRVSAICHICAGFCFGTVVILLIAVYRSTGAITAESVSAFFESARLGTMELIKETLSILSDSAAEVIDISAMGIDPDVIAENIVTVSFNLLPAIAVTLFNALAYLTHSLSLTLLFNDEEKKKRALPMLTFDMSIHSAFIFLITLMLSFLLVSEDTAMYGAAAENVSLLLIPGYVITALSALRAFTMKRAPSCLGALLYFFIIFMVASLSYPVIIATSVCGAIVKIFVFFRQIRKKAS